MIEICILQRIATLTAEAVTTPQHILSYFETKDSLE